jgi:cyclic pyranopterin phosphate synthase
MCTLDTLDRERFKHITRRDDLEKVLEGIELCRKLGYGPIKINAVAVKNLVEPDIVSLARFGRERDIEIRYIEFMPLDAQGIWERDRVADHGHHDRHAGAGDRAARRDSGRRSARASD